MRSAQRRTFPRYAFYSSDRVHVTSRLFEVVIKKPVFNLAGGLMSVDSPHARREACHYRDSVPCVHCPRQGAGDRELFQAGSPGRYQHVHREIRVITAFFGRKLHLDFTP